MGQSVEKSAVEQAWDAYVTHRGREAYDADLADDPRHTAESARLHAAFLALFGAWNARETPSNVIPFRRRA